MTTELSGRDLARETLRQALADAKNRKHEPAVKKKRQLASVKRGPGGREPLALGAALKQVMADRGLEPGTVGGSVLDQWPAIAPELAEHVRAVHYDQKRLRLHLLPSSPAFATQLNLFQKQLIHRINTQFGSRAVHSLQILRPGHAGGQLSMDNRAPAASDCPAITPPVVATGAPPSEEMQAWRTQYRDQRAAGSAQPSRPTSRWFEGVYGKLREPEAEHGNGVTAREEAEEREQRSADSHLRALAVARSQRRTGDPAPLHRIEGAA
jgi:predicted nucleic acid-binding Zn ribbon protein